MSTGFIKLHRCLKQSAFYKDSEYVHLWVHLLMSVNRTQKRLKVDKTNQYIVLLPGQVLTSRDKLSEQTGISSSKIQRILKSFESEQQIEQQTFSKYRVISITKWQQYQHTEQQLEQQVNSNRTASEQQVNTNKKEEKEKKEEEKPLLRVSDVSALYQKYAGVNVVNGGQVAVFQDFIKRFTPEAIEEAFAAAASANISISAFLNWCKTRLERTQQAQKTDQGKATDEGEKEIAYYRSLGYDL